MGTGVGLLAFFVDYINEYYAAVLSIHASPPAILQGGDDLLGVPGLPFGRDHQHGQRDVDKQVE